MHIWFRAMICLFATMWLMYGGATLHADPELMATLPFVPNSGDIPIVEIQLSDTHIGTFLVDTGVTGSLLSDTMAKRLSLKLNPLYPEYKDFKDHLLGKVEVPKVKIGQRYCRIEFVEVREKDLSTDTPIHLDGIIGLNVLKDSGVLFDFKNRQVKIWNAGNLGDSLLTELGMLDKQSFMMHNTSSSEFQFTVPVQINKQVTTDMLLDTGAASIGISTERVTQLQLKRSEVDKSFTSLGSKAEVDVFHIDSLHLGLIMFSNLNIVRVPDELAMHPKNVIGRPILSQFQVLFDFPAKTVYFSPKVPFKTIVPLANTIPKKYAWTVAYKQAQSYSKERTFTLSGTFSQGKVHTHVQSDRFDYLVKEIAPDGQITFQFKQKPIRLEVDGKQQSFDFGPAMTYTQVRSRQGMLLKDSHLEATDDMMVKALMMLESLPVPDHPVDIGETWNTLLDSRTDPGKQITLASTLVGEETVDGQMTLKVHIFTQIPLKGFPEDTIFADEFYYITPETGQFVKRDLTLSNVNVAFVTVPGEQVKGTFVLKEQLIPSTTGTTDKRPEGN